MKFLAVIDKPYVQSSLKCIKVQKNVLKAADFLWIGLMFDDSYEGGGRQGRPHELFFHSSLVGLFDHAFSGFFQCYFRSVIRRWCSSNDASIEAVWLVPGLYS